MPPDSVDEELPAVLSGILEPGALYLVPHHGDDVFNLHSIGYMFYTLYSMSLPVLHTFLVVTEQVRDFAGRQKVVDQHQEALVGHLGVGHEEDGSQVLESSLLVEVRQVELQVCARVSLAQCNL